MSLLFTKSEAAGRGGGIRQHTLNANNKMSIALMVFAKIGVLFLAWNTLTFKGSCKSLH